MTKLYLDQGWDECGSSGRVHGAFSQFPCCEMLSRVDRIENDFKLLTVMHVRVVHHVPAHEAG